MRSLSLFVALLALLTLFLTPGSTLANTEAGTPRVFRETGHTLGYGFREFYERHGGLPVFGFPLTEVFVEDGRPVQYFERARLELHGNLGLVQAGHLGRWAAERHSGHPAFEPLSATTHDGLYFSQTGHTLAGAFLDFWLQRGGVATFGYPISEPFDEQSAHDGRTRTVQYFERARLELHPANQPDHQVQPGHLGRQYLAAHSAPASALQPVEVASRAWESLRPTRVRVPRIELDTAIVSAGFSLGEWDVPRHTAVHYWPIAGYPGTAGNIILAGHVGYRGEIFHRLPEVQQGDSVLVTYGGQERRYLVREVLTVLPSETRVMGPTPHEQLTLITCIPIGVYSHRLIVRATPA